jgi:hypothetical protein
MADGAVGLVHVLAAGARRAVGVDPQVLVQNLDLDGLVDHRIDPDAGEAGVAALLGIKRRDAHQPVHARFGLEPTIRIGADHCEGGGLDPRLLARAFLKPFDLAVVLLGPARVHAHQHLRPVL